MAGTKYSADFLNKTLLAIIKLLNDNNIKGWFVCYGTLLGLIRENSCIDGDDDIDIIINKNNYHKLKQLLLKSGFQFDYRYGIGFPPPKRTWNMDIISKNSTLKELPKSKPSMKILKTMPSKEYASIDMYMADFNDGNVQDLWNNLKITDCFLDNTKQTFIEYLWNGNKLYFPNNYIKILVNRYGNQWNIKKDGKVRQTMTTL